MKVSAGDKGTGKSESITITNDKGRLSQDEIDRMIAEAQEFAEEDKATSERIQARNGLENYVWSLKNQANDEEGLGGKIDEDDKETLLEAVKETADWLDSNAQDATTEDFEEQKEKLSNVVSLSCHIEISFVRAVVGRSHFRDSLHNSICILSQKFGRSKSLLRLIARLNLYSQRDMLTREPSRPTRLRANFMLAWAVICPPWAVKMKMKMPGTMSYRGLNLQSLVPMRKWIPDRLQLYVQCGRANSRLFCVLDVCTGVQK